MTTTPALELTGLTCTLGRFTLGPIDLTVPRGVILGLVGPNGAGKTTTLDLIMGLGRPDDGTIRVLGYKQPEDDVAIKLRTAYVGPNDNFTAWGRVGRLVDFISGFYPDWNATRCDRLMHQFQLTRSDKIAALSFGARIKVSLLLALSRDPTLLLLDEPTLGLDVASRRLLFAELLEAMKREDCTIIISSHQLSDLERLADHIAIIKDGHLLAMSPTDSLLSRYSQIDATLTTGGRMPELDGIRLLTQDGDRLRLLLDHTVARHEDLPAHGIALLSETPMTLEELFVALTMEKAA